MKTVVIVGLGLMGGSLAAAIKANGLAQEVLAIEPDRRSADFARANKLVDRVVDVVPRDADVVALCLPLDLVARWVLELRTHSGTVLDVGSVKHSIVQEVVAGAGALPANFVPCHPIAGSEKSGPQAADAALFRDRVVVLTPTAATDGAALAVVQALWEGVGARTVRLSSTVHDRAIATTSHLPHLLSFAFMQQVDRDQLDCAGPGFRDFTRIAAANPELWWRIFQLNRDELLAAVAQFNTELAAMVAAIEQDDAATGLTRIAAAASRRGEFDGD